MEKKWWWSVIFCRFQRSHFKHFKAIFCSSFELSAISGDMPNSQMFWFRTELCVTLLILLKNNVLKRLKINILYITYKLCHLCLILCDIVWKVIRPWIRQLANDTPVKVGKNRCFQLGSFKMSFLPLLPPEIWETILDFCDTQTLLSFQQTCFEWSQIVQVRKHSWMLQGCPVEGSI